MKAAAALDCLNIAVDHWTASDGQLDLVDLLDEAFATLGPRYSKDFDRGALTVSPRSRWVTTGPRERRC